MSKASQLLAHMSSINESQDIVPIVNSSKSDTELTLTKSDLIKIQLLLEDFIQLAGENLSTSSESITKVLKEKMVRAHDFEKKLGNIRRHIYDSK